MGYHIKRTKKEDILERMAKLGPKGQDECRRHEAFEVAGGWGPPRPPEAGECLVLICALWGYMLPCFILQWNAS